MTDRIDVKKFLLATAVTALLAAPADAQQLAPAPRAAPRTPVNRETLYESRNPLTREVQGQALIIDGDKLKIGAADLRLFGAVPPSLAASFGPQARGVLDNLTANQVTDCRIRDRDRDGRLLATCHNAAGSDLALELLRRGLAVSARGSLADTDLAATYIAAEQAAQAQRLGLWSVTAPAPASAASIVDAAKADAAATQSPAATLPPPAPPATLSAADARKEDIRREDKTAQALDDKALAKALAPVVDNAVQPPVTASVAVSQLGPNADEMTMPNPGFFARYQILIASLLMLFTATVILIAFALQRRHEKRDEMKATAAALRGELLAMRAICQTRIKLIAAAEDDNAVTWPKLRATLYQAYVGRLGFLGAELARQIASIYGQASDYAAYYSAGDDGRVSANPKKQALQMLTAYIEEVLPRLASIEQTGQRPHSFAGQGFMPEAPRAARAAPMPAYRPSRPAPAATPPSVDETRRTQTAAATAAQMTPPMPAANPAPLPEPIITPAAKPPHAASYAAGTPAKLWDSLRHFARAQFGDKPPVHDDDGIGDYTSLIEQDMASLSFTEDDGHSDLMGRQPYEAKRRGMGT